MWQIADSKADAVAGMFFSRLTSTAGTQLPVIVAPLIYAPFMLRPGNSRGMGTEPEPSKQPHFR